MHTEALVQLVDEKRGVSMVEIMNALRAEGVSADGEMVAYWPYEPVVLWINMSQEAIDEVGELLKDPRIEVSTTTPMVYMIDGLVPQMPTANVKSVERRHPYKSERWLPVEFNPKAS